MASENSAQCVILAGGLATRLRPITESIPKALVPVQGRPFLDYQLRYLASHGVGEVVLSIGYRGQMIRDFAGDGSKWGLKISYVDEGDQLRGTGGAIRLIFDRGLLRERFLVLYGDSFLPVGIGAIWQGFLRSSAPAFLSIFRNDGQWDTSNVLFEGGELMYDKRPSPELAARMHYIDYGLMGFSRELVEARIPGGQKSDLADFLTRLCCEKKILAVEVKERFYEVGSPAGLQDFENYLKTAKGIA